MDPFAKFNGYKTPEAWQLDNLADSPETEWARMLRFVQITPDDQQAMLATIEPLFRRGHELVVGTYDYLRDQPETAAILGWEKGADPAHLAERRRFFTVWLARLLGMDMSDDFARYLFVAGKKHAAHGPRKTHVPPVYVSGSISLVNAAFARFLYEEMPGDPIVPAALAGWNKVLTLHQHMMLTGYQVALAVDSGDFPVEVRFFGLLRTIAGSQELAIRVNQGAQVEQLLRKLFNYYPELRGYVLEQEWTDGVREDSTGTPWFEATPVYRVRPMWRVLLNGKDISYRDGIASRLEPEQELHVFPPGR
ncbi:MAG: MoaD/ThiS family protein [Caldilineaceae bacterium]|nr:MoaD/ThiS family protein [Caldilineaceae bacterium]